MTASHHSTRKSSPKPTIALAKAQVSRHLSRRLPYYLIPGEAHQLINAAENERDRLFLKTRASQMRMHEESSQRFDSDSPLHQSPTLRR